MRPAADCDAKATREALATSGRQEGPSVSCSPTCGDLRMKPVAVDGRNNRDTIDPTSVTSIMLHAFKCPRRIISLGLRFNVAGADVLNNTLLLYVKSRLFLPSMFRFSLATLKCNPRQGLAWVNNHSTDQTGRNDMIPRRLGRVAIISSIGGLPPT